MAKLTLAIRAQIPLTILNAVIHAFPTFGSAIEEPLRELVALSKNSEFPQHLADSKPKYVAFDLGDVAKYVTTSDKMILASGIPTRATACAAATANPNAPGSANPISSLALIITRRAINRFSSHASSMRAE